LDAYEADGHIAVRDPEYIQEETLLLPRLVYFVATLLDGRRDVRDVQAVFSRMVGGEELPSEVIDRVVKELDHFYLLDTPRFEEKRSEIERAYVSATRRPAFHLNRPADDLQKFLDGFYKKGPGAPPKKVKKPKPVAGLIAPHIDYYRGGPSYAHAYKALAEMQPADIYIILGVAHASPPAPYILTDKDFDTPFGSVECDRDFVRRLIGRLPGNPMRYQLVHRTEHSVEFQVVYLKHVLPRPFKIVPILCGSFEPLCGAGKPSKHDEIEMFILAMLDTIEETQESVCIVSGADLAHVGKRFGDDFDISPDIIEWVKKDDHASLDHAMDGDAESFYASVMADGNKRKVCGLSSIYTTARLLRGKGKGKLLDYGYAPDPAGGIVSFASVIYPAENGRKSR
jgi:hypothetical protein